MKNHLGSSKHTFSTPGSGGGGSWGVLNFVLIWIILLFANFDIFQAWLTNHASSASGLLVLNKVDVICENDLIVYSYYF